MHLNFRNYKTVRQIAIGSYGTVDLVQAPSGNLYAKKTLDGRDNFGIGPKVLGARFAAEIAMMRKIHHPNVMPVLASVTGSQSSTYLMPFANRILWSELKRDKIDLDESIKILTQMLDALDAIHEAGLHHRDLCPANIVGISLPEKPIVWKLTDFGVAAEIGAEPGLGRRGCGRDPFAAPETCKVPFKGTAKSDIFSWGELAKALLKPRMSEAEWHKIEPVVDRSRELKSRGRYSNIHALRIALNKVVPGIF